MFDVQEMCQQLPHSVVVFAFFAYPVWEYFMGKTKFGSTVEMILEHPLTWLLSKTKKQ